MKLQLEEWNSSHNRRERHWFLIDGDQHGYQGERKYVFGVNPKVVSESTVAKIKELIEGQNGTPTQR